MDSRGLLLAAVLSVAAEATARAQVRPATPRPSPSPVAGAPASEQAPRPPRWALRLRVQESYDSNAEFTDAEGSGSFEDQVGAGLTLRLAGRRGELSLSGDGWGRRYHSVDGSDGFNYLAGLAGSHRFSPRVTGRVRGSFSDSVTRYERQLVDAGLQLPLTRTQTIDTSASLAFQLAAKTTFTAEGRYERARFEADGLTDGEQLAAGASLARALSSSDRLSLNYSLRHIRREEDEDRQVHDVFAGWSRTLVRRLSAELLGGVSLRPAVGELESRTDPYGSAALTYGFQHGSLQARYSHTLGEAYGLGRERVADVVSATLERRFGRRVDGSLGASYGFSKDPSDPTFRYRAQTASAGLGVLLTRELRLIAAYGLSRSREGDPAEPVVSQFGSLSLVYGVEWQ
jgi:hypothetical protein